MTTTREYLIFTVQAKDVSDPESKEPKFDETWGLIALTEKDDREGDQFSEQFIQDMKESIPDLVKAFAWAERDPGSNKWLDSLGTNIERDR